MANDRIANVPDKFKGMMQKCLDGKGGRKNAIKTKCYECCGWEDVQERVESCTVKSCPLWSFRPKRIVKKEK